jgi:glutamate dehydrogenase (NAD(P)+)
MNVGATTTGVVTGKPLNLGGSLGRVRATGHGVFVTGREAMRRLKIPLEGARVSIQGFGNVGAPAAELFARSGAKIVAVQDHGGTIYNAAGLDVVALDQHVQRFGSVAGFAGGESIGLEDFWDVDMDVLIPAALEGQITAPRAARLRAKIVLEAANGPTVTEADDILAERGIVVLPDVICNAGGVIVSYFEWVQDFSSFFWSEEEVNQRLDKIITGALAYIWDTAERHKISLRTGAFVVACGRILTARAERGLYP